MTAKPLIRPSARNFGFMLGLFIVIFACLLRVIAAKNAPLWIDELISLSFVAKSSSVADIFAIHHDNNHFLNTAYLFWVGADVPRLIMRLLSVICGIGLITLLLHEGRRRGSSILIGSILFGFSYPLVYLSSLARGYLPMAFFAMASYVVMRKYCTSHHLASVAAFILFSTLAFFFHLTYFAFYFSLLCWAFFLLREHNSFRRTVRSLIPCLLPVGIVITAFVLTDFAGMQFEGGPRLPLEGVYLLGIAEYFGLPNNRFLLLVFGLVAGVLTIIALERNWHEDKPNGILQAGTIIVFPLLILAVVTPDYLHHRYFLLSAIFVLLLMQDFLSRLWRRHISAKVCTTAFLVLYVAGNMANILPFMKNGFGDWQSAFAEAEHSGAKTVAMENTKDIHKFMYWYYRDYLSPGSAPVFRNADPSTANPRWLLVRKADIYETPEIRPEHTLLREVSGDGKYWAVYERRM